MPGIHRLTQRDIDRAEPGKRLSDGGGLFLHVRDKGAMYWAVQVTIKAAYGRGKRVELGLGPYPDVKLRAARDAAAEARAAARYGTDPREARRKQLKKSLSFEEVCEQAFEARKAELKDDGKAGAWMTPLKNHVLPVIGNRPIEKIHQTDIVDALKPIWHTKADTARKAMNRINLVLKYAAAMDIEVDLQATDKARALLGKTRHVPTKIPAMDWRDVPAFYATLGIDDLSALALRLTILTGSRSKPVRFAHVDQFQDGVWTIPAENMKGQKGKTSDFRIPLSAEAQKVVRVAEEGARDGYLFPSPRRGVISDAAMAKYMKDRGIEARPHGFRTSLRTWLAEATDTPHEVAETCLAHASGNSTVDSYRRTDFLEQRAALLERWADHVIGGTGERLKLVGAATGAGAS